MKNEKFDASVLWRSYLKTTLYNKKWWYYVNETQMLPQINCISSFKGLNIVKSKICISNKKQINICYARNALKYLRILNSWNIFFYVAKSYWHTDSLTSNIHIYFAKPAMLQSPINDEWEQIPFMSLASYNPYHWE